AEAVATKAATKSSAAKSRSTTKPAAAAESAPAAKSSASEPTSTAKTSASVESAPTVKTTTAAVKSSPASMKSAATMATTLGEGRRRSAKKHKREDCCENYGKGLLHFSLPSNHSGTPCRNKLPSGDIYVGSPTTFQSYT